MERNDGQSPDIAVRLGDRRQKVGHEIKKNLGFDLDVARSASACVGTWTVAGARCTGSGGGG